MARQDIESELIAAELRYRRQRDITLEAGRKPMQQLQPHLVWMLPAGGLVLGYGFGRVVTHRILPSIWYAGSMFLQLVLAGLTWRDRR